MSLTQYFKNQKKLFEGYMADEEGSEHYSVCKDIAKTILRLDPEETEAKLKLMNLNANATFSQIVDALMSQNSSFIDELKSEFGIEE